MKEIELMVSNRNNDVLHLLCKPWDNHNSNHHVRRTGDSLNNFSNTKLQSRCNLQVIDYLNYGRLNQSIHMTFPSIIH